MITFTLRGQRFGLTFHHRRQQVLVDYRMPLRWQTQPYETVAQIHVLDEAGHSVARWEGVAQCHPRDTFRYETGRKLALARAIYGMGTQLALDKSDRRLIWTAYFLRGSHVEAAPEPVAATA